MNPIAAPEFRPKLLSVSCISLSHLFTDTQGSQRIIIDPTLVHVVQMDWSFRNLRVLLKPGR